MESSSSMVTVTINAKDMDPITFKLSGEATPENVSHFFEESPDLIWFSNYELIKDSSSTPDNAVFNLISKKIEENEAVIHAQRFASIVFSPFHSVNCGQTVSTWILNTYMKQVANALELSESFPTNFQSSLPLTIKSMEFQEFLSDFETSSGIVAKFTITPIDTHPLTILASSDGYFTESNSNHYISIHLLLCSLSPAFSSASSSYAKYFSELKYLERPLYSNQNNLYSSYDSTAPLLQSYKSFLPGTLDEQLENLHSDQILTSSSIDSLLPICSATRLCEERQITTILKGVDLVSIGRVPPINDSHNFIWNDIFYAPMKDLTIYSDRGGAETNDKTACHEIHLRSQYLPIDPSIRIVRTAIVDRFTQRWFVQGVIPGIITHRVSQDYGIAPGETPKTFHRCEVFDQYFSNAAKQFGIAPSQIAVKSDEDSSKLIETQTIMSSAETSGLRGADGHLYAIDLHRITPRDSNFPNDHAAIIRSEAISIYSDFLVLESRKNEMMKFGITRENLYRPRGTNPAAKNAITKILEQKDEILNDPQIKARLTFDVNALTLDSLNAATIDKCPQNIKDISDFVKKLLIPQFATEFLQFYPTLVDGRLLVSEMHSHGINARYLGEVYNSLPKSASHMKTIIDIEITARSIKRICRAAVLPLQAFLSLINDISPKISTEFWNDIEVEAKKHFLHVPAKPTALSTPTLKLRVLSIFGVTLTPGTDLSSQISENNVSGIHQRIKYPLIVSACPAIQNEVRHCIELYEANKGDEALSLIQNTINHVVTAFGQFSDEIATLYKYEALILMKKSNYTQAMAAAHNSAIVFERTRAESDPDVIFIMTLLGDIAFQMGEKQLAFAFAARAAMMAGKYWRFFPWTLKTVMRAADMAEILDKQQAVVLAKMAIDICSENGINMKTVANMVKITKNN